MQFVSENQKSVEKPGLLLIIAAVKSTLAIPLNLFINENLPNWSLTEFLRKKHCDEPLKSLAQNESPTQRSLFSWSNPTFNLFQKSDKLYFEALERHELFKIFLFLWAALS